MSIVIRDLLDEEVDAAAELWHEAGLTRPWNDPHEDCRRALRGQESAVLGAYAGERLAGTVMVGHDGHRGWIYYLAVAGSSRGEGIGRQLVEAAERWVLSRGVPKLMLMVRRENSGVVDFYHRLGYEDEPPIVLSRRLSEG